MLDADMGFGMRRRVNKSGARHGCKVLRGRRRRRRPVCLRAVSYLCLFWAASLLTDACRGRRAGQGAG